MLGVVLVGVQNENGQDPGIQGATAQDGYGEGEGSAFSGDDCAQISPPFRSTIFFTRVRPIPLESRSPGNEDFERSEDPVMVPLFDAHARVAHGKLPVWLVFLAADGQRPPGFPCAQEVLGFCRSGSGRFEAGKVCRSRPWVTGQRCGLHMPAADSASPRPGPRHAGCRSTGGFWTLPRRDCRMPSIKVCIRRVRSFNWLIFNPLVIQLVPVVLDKPGRQRADAPERRLEIVGHHVGEILQLRVFLFEVVQKYPQLAFRLNALPDFKL